MKASKQAAGLTCFRSFSASERRGKNRKNLGKGGLVPNLQRLLHVEK
jgi:hypothetical protein